MNRLFITIITIFTLVSTSYAQLDQGMLALKGQFGYANLQGELGENGSAGLAGSADVRYFIMDKLAVGGEISHAIIGFGDDNSFIGISAYGATGYNAKGEFYFLNKGFSPYVGLAAGVARVTTPEFTSDAGVLVPEEGKTNFGFSPRIGLKMGNVQLEAAYNVMGRTPTSEFQNVSSSNKPFNYLSITIGYSRAFELN
ncbi:MAG: hypothetical protein AAFY71_14385 [Bacteroidota bacterium]